MTEQAFDPTFDVLRLLPEDRPLTYERLPEPERAWRGRYFLMVLSMGASEMFAWANALMVDPANEKEARELVSRTPDWQIVEALKLRNAPDREELPNA